MATLDIRGVLVLFDDDDSELVSRHKWWITPQGYACTKIKRENGSRRTIGMHRLILGDPATPATDHINRNRLDNRRCNLMACTDSHNNKNVPTRNNKTSGHRGVSKRGDRWQAVVRINGKLKWLGVFDSEDEAAAMAAPHFAGIEA